MKFFSIISFTVLAATLFLASGVEPAARPAANPLPKVPFTPTQLDEGFKHLRPTIVGARDVEHTLSKVEQLRDAKDQLHMATEFYGQGARARAKTAGRGNDEPYIKTLENQGEKALKSGAEYNKLLHKTEMLQKAAAEAARMNNPKAAAVALEQSRVAAQELAANSKTPEQKKKTSRILRKFRSMRKAIMRKLKWLLSKATFGKYKYDKKKKPVAAAAPAAPVAVAVAAPAPASPGAIVAAAAAAV